MTFIATTFLHFSCCCLNRRTVDSAFVLGLGLFVYNLHNLDMAAVDTVVEDIHHSLNFHRNIAAGMAHIAVGVDIGDTEDTAADIHHSVDHMAAPELYLHYFLPCLFFCSQTHRSTHSRSSP
eukprot:NODE_328_length_10919_cov_0.472828.p8 type:complete len:122 gc:universal NODE_328_length_10919_cov_0.472828:5852-5487(-)